MLTNIALYYYLIYTPLQFWPCEAQTHLAMRSFSLPQHGTTAGIFNNKGKAIIEIAHLDAYSQYGLLLGTPIRLSQNITLESNLGGIGGETTYYLRAICTEKRSGCILPLVCNGGMPEDNGPCSCLRVGLKEIVKVNFYATNVSPPMKVPCVTV
ncbi:MAG: Uncharacterised protein [Flavobacteriales bacterium UBA4585]|nr:MAG: Uncharacterised protein [Flavobacteriales bacterium UBA4585]